MMKNTLYPSGFKTKYLLTAACVLAFSHVALALDISAVPPPLPPIGGVSVPALPAPDSASSSSSSDVTRMLGNIPAPESGDKNAALSDLAALPSAPEEKPQSVEKPAEKEATPLPPAPELAKTEPAKTEAAALTPPPGLLPLPALPGSDAATTKTDAPPPLLPLPGLGASSDTKTDVIALEKTPAKASKKSWETTLAPTRVPEVTKFRYRRNTLPETIYSQNYTEQNKHLPIAFSYQDYNNLLFDRVLHNDVDAVRALLNSGASVNIRAVNGETPLAAARRAGAMATADLLVARGAKL